MCWDRSQRIRARRRPRSRSHGFWRRSLGSRRSPAPPSKLHRLEENIGGASVELSADNLHEIETALSNITVQGDRYPAHLQARVGR